MAARNTFEMPAPDSIHPPQSESNAKAIDTWSISLDGLAVATRGVSLAPIPMEPLAAVGGRSEGLPPSFSALAPPLPDLGQLLVRLVMLLHMGRQARAACAVAANDGVGAVVRARHCFI